MGTNLLSGNFTISGTSANDVYNSVITDPNLNTGNITPLIDQRVNDVIFNGKNKANNGYNSILTYIAAEAILAVITQQTSIVTSGSSSGVKPAKIPASFTTINAEEAVTISKDTESTTTETGALRVAGGVGIIKNLNVGGNVGITGNLILGSTRVTADADDLNLLDGVTAGSVSGNKVAVYDGNGVLKSNHLGNSALNGPVATKNYVDSVAQGLSVKKSVKVATTANGTLSSSFVHNSLVDGITITTGDRILIKNQTTESDNGIYTVNASGVPTRATDFDADADVNSGAFIFIQEGNTQADTGWVLTTDGTIEIGTTSLSFTQFSKIAIPQPLSTDSAPTFNGLTLNGALDANSTADIADTLTLSKVSGTGLSVTSDATVGGTLEVTGATTLTAALAANGGITFSTAIIRATNTQQSNDSNNIANNITDIYAKIRHIDAALTLLLQNVDISSSLNSGNPFFVGAGYGSNTATSDSLSYTA